MSSLHIKIIQALDVNGNVVLAKNVDITVDSGNALEIVYRVIKHGQQSKMVLDPAEQKDIKEFSSWLNELPEKQNGER